MGRIIDKRDRYMEILHGDKKEELRHRRERERNRSKKEICA